MTTRALYTLKLPANAQTLNKNQLRNRVGELAALEEDLGAVTAVGLQPGQQVLRGNFRGQLAAKLAQEVEELFRSSGYEEVPFYGVSAATNQDGYYALKDVSLQEESSLTEGLQTFDGVLTFKGTTKTHFRAIATTPYQPANGNDFGNDTTGYVGVAAAASKVWWFDSIAETRSAASVVATRSGEFGDVEIYDAQASGVTDPVLIHELDYAEEGKTACRVWDTRGNTSKLTSSVPQWGRVFVSGHDFTGNIVVENGLVRLEFDEANNTLSAFDWNDGTSSWDAVALGSESDGTDWTILDVDLMEIGASAVRAQVEFFEATGASYYSLDMILHRGYLDPQWFVPENETPPTPTGLQDKLDPIANTQEVDPQGVQTLVDRSDVRK